MQTKMRMTAQMPTTRKQDYKSLINVSDEGFLTEVFLNLQDQEESLRN
jgi:hypothetical protein